jgi:hypothetical protein
MVMAKIADARRGTSAISSSLVTYIGELGMQRRKLASATRCQDFSALLRKKR